MGSGIGIGRLGASLQAGRKTGLSALMLIVAAGSMALGILEVMFQAYLPENVLPYRDAFVLSLVILCLLFRPEGLIPAPGERCS